MATIRAWEQEWGVVHNPDRQENRISGCLPAEYFLQKLADLLSIG